MQYIVKILNAKSPRLSAPDIFFLYTLLSSCSAFPRDAGKFNLALTQTKTGFQCGERILRADMCTEMITDEQLFLLTAI